MADAAGAEKGADAAVGHGGEIGLGGEAAVTRDLVWFAAEMGAGLIHQQRQGGEISGVGGEALGDNDLVSGSDRDLAVVAGDEAALAGYDAAVACTDAPVAAEAATAPPQAKPAPSRRERLRDAPKSLLAAWDAGVSCAVLEEHIETLRRARANGVRLARTPSAPREAREAQKGTKHQAVLAMLRRTEGATIAQIAEATGWQAHTVRGFLAGLNKRGIAVTVLERVRQVGPNRTGAKGSFSVYGIENGVAEDADGSC